MNRIKLSLAALLAAAPLAAAGGERIAAGPELAKPPAHSGDSPKPGAPAAPPAQPTKGAAVLDEILELSGAKRALQTLPGTIGQIVMKAEKLNDAMSSALMEALSPKPFMDEVLAHLRRHFEPARAQALLDWYRSPLGKRIVALTEAADKDPKELTRKMTQLQRMPPPPERMSVLEKLVKNDDPVGLLTSAAQSLFHGLMSFVTKILPSGKVPPEHVWKRKVQAPKEGTEAFVPLYAASFEALSTEELQKYLDFARSADATWFDKLERAAIDHGMKRAGERMGQAMIKFAMRIRGSL